MCYVLIPLSQIQPRICLFTGIIIDFGWLLVFAIVKLCRLFREFKQQKLIQIYRSFYCCLLMRHWFICWYLCKLEGCKMYKTPKFNLFGFSIHKNMCSLTARLKRFAHSQMKVLSSFIHFLHLPSDSFDLYSYALKINWRWTFFCALYACHMQVWEMYVYIIYVSKWWHDFQFLQNNH